MSNFPLYDSLIIEKCMEDLSFEQKDEFVKIVKNLDDNGHELIYALIRTYQLENSHDKSTFKLPYGGKYVKNDMKFDLNELPNELKNILYKFCLIHEKTIAEEKMIEKNRINNDTIEIEKDKKLQFKTTLKDDKKISKKNKDSVKF